MTNPGMDADTFEQFLEQLERYVRERLIPAEKDVIENDAVPEDIRVTDVREDRQSLPGIENVHDLHVWGLSTTETALTAHLVAPGGQNDEFLSNLRRDLRQRFGIDHTTIQVERSVDEADRCDNCD